MEKLIYNEAEGSISSESLESETENEDGHEKKLFNPPLYLQRYTKVQEIIKSFKELNISKVVDIGCAEMTFFYHLKNTEEISEIILLDKDNFTLQKYCYKIEPNLGEYVLRRQVPLTVTVINGDAALFYEELRNVDAVTMIEFIEHVREVDLPSIVYNVFGNMKPKIIIITTPNADYNKFFDNLPAGNFRHPDHKFEWTEEQFTRWANSVIEDYPCYDVTFSGCGLGPDEKTFCSQTATFLLSQKEEGTPNYMEDVSLRMLPENDLLNANYIIRQIVYPVDSRSDEDKRYTEVCDYIRKLKTWLSDHLEHWDTDEPLKSICKKWSPPWSKDNEDGGKSLIDVDECNASVEFTLIRPNDDDDGILGEERVFYYDVSEDGFFFLEDTFYTWVQKQYEVQIGNILEFENLPYITTKEHKEKKYLLLTFYTHYDEDEDEEENCCYEDLDICSDSIY